MHCNWKCSDCRTLRGGPSSPFGRKLFIDAHASSRVPSTLKCSSDSRPRRRAWSTISLKNSLDTSARRRRSLFLENTEWLKPASRMLMSRNHLKSMSYPRRSQNCLSLRTENNAISRQPFRRCSGGMDGRPIEAYIRLKVLDFVKSGGPKWIVGGTVFEMWLGAL